MNSFTTQELTFYISGSKIFPKVQNAMEWDK